MAAAALSDYCPVTRPRLPPLSQTGLPQSCPVRLPRCEDGAVRVNDRLVESFFCSPPPPPSSLTPQNLRVAMLRVVVESAKGLPKKKLGSPDPITSVIFKGKCIFFPLKNQLGKK